MDAQGRILFNGKLIPITELETRLRTVLAMQERKDVTLCGDQSVGLEEAIVVLDAIRKAGAEAVDILTDKP